LLPNQQQQQLEQHSVVFPFEYKQYGVLFCVLTRRKPIIAT